MQLHLWQCTLWNSKCSSSSTVMRQICPWLDIPAAWRPLKPFFSLNIFSLDKHRLHSHTVGPTLTQQHHYFAIPMAPGLGECQGTDGDRRPDSATSGRAGGWRSRGWKQEWVFGEDEEHEDFERSSGRGVWGHNCAYLAQTDILVKVWLSRKKKKLEKGKRERVSSPLLDNTW